MKLKKESSQKRLALIRSQFAGFRKRRWPIGRAIDFLCERHGLSFQTVARYCGFR